MSELLEIYYPLSKKIWIIKTLVSYQVIVASVLSIGNRFSLLGYITHIKKKPNY